MAFRGPKVRGGRARFDHVVRDGKTKHTVVITAAAQILSGPKIKREGSRAQKSGSSLPWQAEAWELYDLIGEFWYASNWLANAISRARLVAAHAPPGATEPIVIDEGTPAELVADFSGGLAGQAQFLLRAGIHLTVVGDTYFVGRTMAPDVDAGDTPAGPARGIPPVGGEALEGRVSDRPPVEAYDVDWCAYSTDEVSYDSGKWRINDGLDSFEIGDADVIMRCWRPHPRKHHEAQSPVRPSLPVLRELWGLTKHVAAQIDSRLAGAGILFVPQEMTFPTGQGAQGGDATEGEDAFLRDLIESMLTAIKDRDNASAVVPLVVKVPADTIGKIQHVTFSTPLDDKAKDLRDESLRRFALGMDMPPEIVLGLGESNHWSSWQIDESSIKLHVEPLLATICLALTVGWYRPQLEAAGYLDAHDYLVWYDVEDLKQRPNRAKEALDLFDRFIVGADAVRRESGFGDEDAPDKAELARMVLLTLAKQGANIGPILSALGVPDDIVQQITAGVPGPDDGATAPADGGRDIPNPDASTGGAP